MSSTGRSGTLVALSISLAVHLAGAVWFALRPPMFRPARQPAPIEVTLVPPRPISTPPPGGGGGEGLIRAPLPDRSSQAAAPKTVRRTAPARRPTARASRPEVPQIAPPQLPQAVAVEPGPAAPSAPSQEGFALPSVADALGVAGAVAGVGAGSGGGRGGGAGTGTGTGEGAGPGRGVEVKPRELRRPSFAEMRALYPDDARREGLQARVRLQLLVDTSGRVADVRVVRGAGHGFDEAAMDLARRFLFEPGRRDGRPVPMWITLTYSFEIEG